MMISRDLQMDVVRKIHFCYGHRLMNHEGKCATFHGHNGIVWIHAHSISGSTDDAGRVVDFAVIKERIGQWIDQHWDHTMILCAQDQQSIAAFQMAPGKKPLFILDQHPTAEYLAHYLLTTVCPAQLKGLGVRVHRIDFYETENCMATVQLDRHGATLTDLYKNC